MRAAAIVWTWLAAASAAAAVQPSQSPFDACTPSSSTWSYDDLLCLFRAGGTTGRMDEARTRLRAHGAGTDGAPWATLVLGHATLNDDEREAIRLYELAAAGFVATNEAEGEVVARQNLRILYRRRGDVAAATAQVTRALATAEASERPLTIARAAVLEASHLMETGGDVGRAHRGLLRAEQLAFPSAPIGLRRAILFNLANANLYLGQLDAAIDALQRHRALRAEDGSTADAAAVAFNLLNARVTQSEARPVAGSRARLAALANEVVAETRALGRPAIEAQAHRLLGDLLRPADPAQATVHLQRCLDIEKTLGYPDIRAACLWSSAHHEARRAPIRADALSREALALVAADRGNTMLAYAWQARLRLVWATLPAEQAIHESLEALAAIERLRAAQLDTGSRAAVFASWAREYRWLTGKLLERGDDDLEQAFGVGERLRARELLEHAVRAGVPAAQAIGPPRSDVTQRIAATQRRLLSAALSAAERAALREQLTLLELERAETAAPAPVSGRDGVTFARITDVQRALAPHEAMIWFSVAPWTDLYDEFGGGAWAIVITRDTARTHRLDARVELDTQVSALAGLLRVRETPEARWVPAARQLGATLLAGPLSTLGDGVTRLVIAADGPLYQLPFEALIVGGAPIGTRFEMVTAPSATLWLRLRQSPLTNERQAIILADPAVSGVTPDGMKRLEPLPFARREAEAIRARLPDGSAELFVGDAATEAYLKRASFSEHRLLHLAAHARADAAFPERSAVFLAPGDGNNDGWLQPREIASLDLRGLIVVLSACESAEGTLVSGEGPLSLARAFFAGGASAVVATRWALRDDDAASVMEHFYDALAAGRDPSAALHAARRDAMADGRPAAVWAGLVLLGDSGQPIIDTPVRPRSPFVERRWLYVVLFGLWLTVVIEFTRRLSRRAAARRAAASARPPQ